MPLPIDSIPLALPATPRREQCKPWLAGALHRSLLCTLATVLSGCVTLSTPPAAAPAQAPLPLPAPTPALPPAPAPPPVPDATALADAAARRLLAFSERLREMGPVDLVREQARMADAPDASGQAPAQTLEQALLLAQRQQPGDLARAVALLEPLTRATAPAPWQAPARLLHARLYEQRKLEEQLERQAVQLRDQQRRLEQVAAQLEALKAIERSLNSMRGTSQAPAPAPMPRP